MCMNTCLICYGDALLGVLFGWQWGCDEIVGGRMGCNGWVKNGGGEEDVELQKLDSVIFN